MPLQAGTSQETVSENIRELHTGKTYARTRRRKGKKAADKQAVAIALAQRRRSRQRRRTRRHIPYPSVKRAYS